MVITKLQDYNKNRKKICLDNGVTFLLYQGEIKKYHLEENAVISDEEYDFVMTLLYERARERALYLLDDSYKTEKQIRDKLKKGLYPENIIDRVAAYLMEYNLINDLRYASLYIEYKAATRSKKQIIQDLFSKGISKDTIELAFENSEFSDEVSLTKVIEKRINKYNLNEQKDLQKLYRYLIGKGYCYSDVKDALSKYVTIN